MKDDPVNGKDPTGLFDAFKVYDTNQADGAGHVMGVYVDKKGNVSAYESTGDPKRGVVQVQLGKVEVGKDGHVTAAGVKTLEGEAAAHWQAVGADKNPSVVSTQFKMANNGDAFNKLGQAEIATTGKNVSMNPFSTDRRAYHFLGNNCGTFADRLMAAAGATGYSVNLAPNGQWVEENSTPGNYVGPSNAYVGSGN